MDTPAELAAAFQASVELGLRGGMLVTNPIPEEYAMDHEVIDKAIDAGAWPRPRPRASTARRPRPSCWPR